MPDAPEQRRAQLTTGIGWAMVSQAIDVVISFGSMLVLVRIIAPAEYGRAAAVVGMLAFVNTFGCHVFVNHAMQLPDADTPDWQAHWSAALYLQLAVCIVCECVAWGLWFVPAYRPVAPLMHIAGVGILLDGPNQIGAAMLRRQLDFRRLRLLATGTTLLKLATTVVLALAGAGAYALVIGGNVVTGIPYAVHLIFVRRWRPPLGWWRLPSLREYRAPIHFGLQQIATGIVAAASGAAEAAILPGTIGFGAMGLLGRARALYTTTAGRLGSVLTDAVYPFLPRVSTDPERYARHATTFLQVMLFITVPAAAFLGLEGPHVSRLLYGRKWIAMDPLIWPGVLSGVAVTMFMTCAGILLASGRLRSALAIQVAVTVLSVCALFVAWEARTVLWYGWGLTVAEAGAAGVALWLTRPLLTRDWAQDAVYPPVGASIIAASTSVALQLIVAPATGASHVALTTTVFSCVAVIACRVGFPAAFSKLLRLIPGQQLVPAWLAGDATTL